MAPPPVSTQPAPSASSTPPLRRLSLTKYMSSRARGSRISATTRRASICGLGLAISISAFCGNRGHDAVAVLALELLGVRHRHLQADGKIVRKMGAADRNRRRMRDGALEKHNQVAGVSADIEQAYAQFALIGGKGGLSRGNRLQHRLGDFKPGAVGAGNRALQRRAGTGGDVQIDFEPRGDHAHGIEDAGLIVDDELARQQVQNLAVGRALHGAGALDSGAHVFARDLAHAAAQFESAIGIEAADMRTADADHALVDVGAGDALAVLGGGLDHAGGRPEIGDKPLAHAGRLHGRVAAIAQGSLIQIGRQDARRARCPCRALRSGFPGSGSSCAHCPCRAAAVEVGAC